MLIDANSLPPEPSHPFAGCGCPFPIRVYSRNSRISVFISVHPWSYASVYDPVSSGKTFTSTRRFFLLCSELLGSVQPGSGLSQPFPTTLNLFGSDRKSTRLNSSHLGL